MPLLGDHHASAGGGAVPQDGSPLFRSDAHVQFLSSSLRCSAKTSTAAGLERLVVLTMAPYSAHVYEPVVPRDCREAGPQQGLALPGPRLCAVLGRRACAAPGPAGRVWRAATLDAIPEPRVLLPRQERAPVPVGRIAAHSAGGLMARRPRSPARPPDCRSPAASCASRRRCPAHPGVPEPGHDDPDPWLGPDLPTVFERAKTAGAEDRCDAFPPIGFLADHVETLYDLDIVLREQIEALGMRVPPRARAQRLAAVHRGARRRRDRLPRAAGRAPSRAPAARHDEAAPRHG